MAPPELSQDPQEDYFNDLHRRPSDGLVDDDDEDTRRNSGDLGRPLNESQPKAKRIACVLCRKRKLKCDGTRPSCNTCTRLNHDCAYDEKRKKSGPKRGYVKLLEARLQQVETLLKTQDGPDKHPVPTKAPAPPTNLHTAASAVPSSATIIPDPVGLVTEPMLPIPDLLDTAPLGEYGDAFQDTTMAGNVNDDIIGDFGTESFPWEMIGLGLEEPLPSQDLIDELHQIYFEKMHSTTPILHKGRYLAACGLNHQMRPPIALRYAVWTLAVSITDKYDSLAEHFYHRARKYLQADEMKGHGEGIISLQHCQAWILICIYEFKNMYFPRAWQTTGRAVRMAQMLGLHRIDGFGLDVKQCLSPPKDWIEREERRRTFWLAFCEDRYASVGTGWPMTVDERDIMTNLPASEEAFLSGTPEQTTSLEQALKPGGAARLSSIGSVVLVTCMFGRNLLHLHRPGPDDNDEDLNGEFWRRHRRIEGILSHTSLALPDSLRLPAGLGDPNAVFMNMSIHTSSICLHQAAIFKADRHRLPANVGSESRVRCVTAAAEIARIMRMMSHLDLSAMNPFLAFCLYVAARVFVQYLKFRPKDEQMISSLEFLLAAMNALKRKNPLTESFLVQLDVDLEGLSIDLGPRGSFQNEVIERMRQAHNVPDNLRCSPIFEVRDAQAANGTSETNETRRQDVSPAMPNNSLNPSQTSAEFRFSASEANSPSYQLPNRQRPQQFEPHRVSSLGSSLSPTASDQAQSPGINFECGNTSYKDSSSRKSFTPPSLTDTTDSTSQIQNRIRNRPSPQNMSSNSSIQTPSFTGTANNNSVNENNFFGSMDFNFNTLHSASGTSFSGSTGWDMPGLELNGASGGLGYSTGMTPLSSEQDWNTMLDEMDGYAGGSNAGGLTYLSENELGKKLS